MMMIQAKPLSPEAFAPFSQVLTGKGRGEERHAFAARMENLRPDAKPNMTFMSVLPAAAPIRIERLERHSYSNEAFTPLNGTRHLVAVCPSGENGKPDLSGLIAFEADGSQAVNYNAGIWHAPRTAISPPGEFIMFRWDDGSDLDTEIWPLESHIEVNLYLN